MFAFDPASWGLDPKRRIRRPRRPKPEVLLSEREAAAIIGVAIPTMRKWRKFPTPRIPFTKQGCGRIGYKRADIRKFIQTMKPIKP